jgi:hypothetical protein
MALPDPAGRGARGILNALMGSLCFAKPLMSSCSVPSPETETTTSYSSSETSDAISEAWPTCSVSAEQGE